MEHMTLDFYEEFAHLIGEIGKRRLDLGGKDEAERYHKGIALYFLVKAQKTFESIKLLCLNGFADDASILTRSLFEMVIDLLYVDQERGARARLYCEYEIIQKIKLHEKLKKNEDSWSKRILESKNESQLEEALKEYERVKKNYPEPDKWSGKSKKKMAKDIGMEWQYEFVYHILSGIAHTGPNAVSHYMSYKDDGSIEFLSSQQKDIERVWNTSCIYFLILLDRFNDAFGLGLDEEIKKIDAQLKLKTV
jgi:hypothetical protein